MENCQLTTIYYKQDYKTKLQDYINKEEKTIKYLKAMIKYFEDNNITLYNKFDKRDFNKIENYLKEKKMIYYEHCQDNFSVHYQKSIGGYLELYIYINNEQQYNCDIEIYKQNYDGSINFSNVLEQAKKRLEYVETQIKENKRLFNNFDKYIKQFNDKVRDFKKFVDNTHINNILDIYVYANDKD
jgi:hypothetical protein